ncbi:MAG: repeat-containing protein [Pedosphaera sp.]|nr:repeat-containing protein [Pedosphaera sp.]
MKGSEVIQAKRHGKRFYGSLILLAITVTVVIAPAFTPVTITHGDTTITITTGFIAAKNGIGADPSGFFSHAWSDPTGEHGYTTIYGLKLGKWMYRIDDHEDPVTTARRKLPTTSRGLIHWLDSDNFLFSRLAAEEMVRRGASAHEILPVLLTRLETDDNGYIQDALEKIYKKGAAHSIYLLTNAVAHSNAVVCAKVIEILQELGPDARPAVPALIEALNRNSPALQLRSAYALSKINLQVQAPIPVMVNLLTNQSIQVRAGAACVLGEFGPKAATAVPLLLLAVQNPDVSLRSMSARALGLIGPAAVPATPFLIQNLDDKNGEVLMWTAKALGQLGRDAKAAIPRLSQMAESDNDEIGRWSIEALGEMGPEAVPALVQALKNSKGYNQQFAANALAKIGPEATNALPAMLEALDDEKTGVVTRALKVLGGMGPAAKIAMPKILELMRDEDESLRLRAAQAAWKIDLPKAQVIPIMMAALKDHSDTHLGARSIAVKALGEIGPEASAALPLLEQEYIGNDPRSHSSLQDDAKAAIDRITSASPSNQSDPLDR